MSRGLLLGAWLLISSRWLLAADCGGFGVEWLPPVLLDIEAPQGMALDPRDNSLWICSAIANEISHVASDSTLLGKLVTPFVGREEQFTGGIAFRDDTETLLVALPGPQEIREITTDGTPTGLVIRLTLPLPPTGNHQPFLKGMEYNSLGDNGRGSIWLIESSMTAVYEITLEGAILTSFCVPDDPDGCPGNGAASPANDLGLRRDAVGQVTGFEITSGRPYRDRLLRLDVNGLYAGNWLALAATGGNLGGFESGVAVNRRTGESRRVLWVTVESRAELHALVVTEPRLLGIANLTSRAEADFTVTLDWTNHGAYETLRVWRDGELLASLPPGAETFLDASPPDGTLSYRVVGAAGDCLTEAVTTTVVGAGQVLREAVFPGYWAIDLAEDGAENLWVTDARNQIFVHDKELNVLAEFPGPFQAPGDETTGIAYHPAGNTMFVYNATTNVIVEINNVGDVVSGPFPSGVPDNPDQPAGVSSLLFNPTGADGAGTFWLLDSNSAQLEERDLAGNLIGSCQHPDQAREPPPPGARLGAYVFGFCEVPGSNWSELYLSGGSVREQRAARIFRATTTCVELDDEISTSGIEVVTGHSYLVALHRTQHAGKDVFYAIDSLEYRSRLLEIETRPPSPRPVRHLSCSQPTDDRAVQLTFTPPSTHDGVEIRRDGNVLVTLPAGTSSHVDTSAPAGLRHYEVRSLLAGKPSDERACSIQVGIGSRVAREFARGMALLHALTHDPTDGSYLAASSLNRYADELHRFDRNLDHVESIPAPFASPDQTAAIALRAVGGTVEVYCLGWRPGAPAAVKELPLIVIDRSGAFLRRAKLTPPAPRGGFVSYPAGLVHDPRTDTLWLHERNAFVVAQIALDGSVLRQFPHPAPPNQYRVDNFGIGIDPERGVLFLSTGGSLEHEVTRLVELTDRGQLTGVEIPIGLPEYQTFAGFVVLPGSREIVAMSKLNGSVWDLVRYRSSDPLAAAQSLTCELRVEGATLSWTNGESYDAVAIHRGAELATMLPGDATTWTDATLPVGQSFYRVVGVKGELHSPGTLCQVDSGVFFIRGDVEENGVVNITDAIAILLYLFSGGTTPRCLDAADTDDSGALDITDAVALLGYLFTAGRPPVAPFPNRGIDGTADAMECGS